MAIKAYLLEGPLHSLTLIFCCWTPYFPYALMIFSNGLKNKCATKHADQERTA